MKRIYMLLGYNKQTLTALNLLLLHTIFPVSGKPVLHYTLLTCLFGDVQQENDLNQYQFEMVPPIYYSNSAHDWFNILSENVWKFRFIQLMKICWKKCHSKRPMKKMGPVLNWISTSLKQIIIPYNPLPQTNHVAPNNSPTSCINSGDYFTQKKMNTVQFPYQPPIISGLYSTNQDDISLRDVHRAPGKESAWRKELQFFISCTQAYVRPYIVAEKLVTHGRQHTWS